MGILHHFFKSRDVNRRVKYWIYLVGLVNTLLWGLQSWNLSHIHYNKLRIFHHAAIKYILNLGWEEIKEERITNEESDIILRTSQKTMSLSTEEHRCTLGKQ